MKKQKIKVLGNKILCKRLSPEEKTSGGLFIPDNARERTSAAEVLDIGVHRSEKDNSIIPMSVKPGDIILFSEHEHLEVPFQGETYVMLRDENIFGVVETKKGKSIKL